MSHVLQCKEKLRQLAAARKLAEAGPKASMGADSQPGSSSPDCTEHDENFGFSGYLTLKPDFLGGSVFSPSSCGTKEGRSLEVGSLPRHSLSRAELSPCQPQVAITG
jgi:hypothetical protein